MSAHKPYCSTFVYEVQNKLTGKEKLGNPHGFKKGIELIPANAKNMKELKSVKVKWDCGDKVYEKNSIEFKCFEESSGCFDIHAQELRFQI